ncbi:MAG: hypothetical protein PHE83_16060 [Opitutaceae bacterium]|nr:hypothetical protein [Opitutaceae bacterium]
MKTHAAEPCPFEFYFPSLDTLVRVEDSAGEVIIRASRNTFSQQRRACFIRELAAEGFIPDHYQWSLPAGLEASPGVHWLVDTACFKPDQALAAGTRRFMVQLLASAALLWLLMIGFLILCQAR